MKLREQFFVRQRRQSYTLSQFRNSLGHRTHTIFILRRKKEGSKKRAVHPIAKGQFGGPQLHQEIVRKGAIILERWTQQSVPVFGGIARKFWRSGAHFIFGLVGLADGGGAAAGAAAGPVATGARVGFGADDFSAVCAGVVCDCAAAACVFNFGAPVKPATPLS
jgi:hypothetical protein